MKIEKITDDKYTIFINNIYLKIENFDDKEEIIKNVKDVIMKIKNKLSLRGFYKIKVYVNKRIGLFLNLVRLEELDFSNILDLRVIVYLNEEVYFETEDIDILPSNKKIHILNNKYYCNAKYLDIMKIVEFGRFVYGIELSKLLNKSHVL